MLYSIICILCMMVMTYILFRMEGMGEKKGRPMFINIIIIGIIFLMLDMCWGFLDSKLGVPEWFANIISVSYYTVAGVLCYCWFLYSEQIQRAKWVEKKVFHVLTALPLFLVLLLSMYLLYDEEILFSFFQRRVLYRGIGYVLIFSMICVYLLISLVKATIKRKIGNKEERRNNYFTIATFSLCPLIFGCLQVMYPQIPLLGLGITVAILQTYMFAHSFEEEQKSGRSMMESFGRLFMGTYRLHLPSGRCFKIASERNAEEYTEDGKNYEEVMEGYIRRNVYREDVDKVRKMCSSSYIKENLSKETPFYFFDYRMVNNGVICQFRMHIVLASVDLDDNVENVVFSVMDVEKETSYERQIRHYRELLSSAISDIYYSLLKIDLNTMEAVSLFIQNDEIVEEPLEGTWEDEFRRITKEMHPDYRGDAKRVWREVKEHWQDGYSTTLNYQRKSEEEEEYRWFSSSIRVFQDEGTYVMTLFTIDNTDEINERRQMLEEVNKELTISLAKESQYKKAITSEALGYGEYNITQNKTLDGEMQAVGASLVGVVSELGMSKALSLPEIAKVWEENKVDSNKEAYRRHMDRDYLISCYEKGKREVTMEYKSHDENGNVSYNTHTWILTKDEVTGDILGLAILEDVTAERVKERENIRQLELIQGLSVDYSSVYLIDCKTQTMQPYRLGNATAVELGEMVKELETFDKIIPEYIKNSVYHADREMMQEICDLQHIIDELQEKESFYLNYRVQREDSLQYHQIRFVKVGQENEISEIVMGFRSVDEEIKNEMSQKKLVEDALMQAEHANKAKSIFLSNMSHDIRTPMNAIIGFTALASTHIDNKETVQNYLQKIMSSSNHLLSLINDVLDMSRIESGKIQIEEKECNLSDIMHDIRALVQPQIRAKQLDFYIDTVDVVDEDVYCDKLRLNQVLLNLFSNAIKFTQPGGVITVRIRQKAAAPKGHASYSFSVRDTGVGIGKEFLEHIFEPFEREKNTTTSGVQGTGLGLSITKNIVDMMGGTIEVQSELGKGTEFTVDLDFRLQSEHNEVEEIESLKGLRALVVDDDFNTCESVTRMLAQIGMRSEWTMSGKEAVLRAQMAVDRKDEFHAYIIDWLMPDMNGIEVVRRIRREIGENIPIIILTAYDWTDIEEEAREAGVTYFCSKPIFLSDLKRILLSAQGLYEQEENDILPTEKNFVGKRILMAEDNDLNREIAVELLQEAGFAIDTVIDGSKAVERIEEVEAGYYDVILMDVQMPVMNGYEATKKIRELKDSEKAKIPILALTANAFEEDKETALSYGMNDHVAKPIDIANLLQILDKIL